MYALRTWMKGKAASKYVKFNGSLSRTECPKASLPLPQGVSPRKKTDMRMAFGKASVDKEKYIATISAALNAVAALNSLKT